MWVGDRLQRHHARLAGGHLLPLDPTQNRKAQSYYPAYREGIIYTCTIQTDIRYKNKQGEQSEAHFGHSGFRYMGRHRHLPCDGIAQIGVANSRVEQTGEDTAQSPLARLPRPVLPWILAQSLSISS